MDYGVKVVDKSYEGVIGVQLQHKHLEVSIVVFSCYLPPENSPWGRDSVGFYSQIVKHILIVI